jgi:hypothetical protein
VQVADYAGALFPSAFSHLFPASLNFTSLSKSFPLSISLTLSVILTFCMVRDKVALSVLAYFEVRSPFAFSRRNLNFSLSSVLQYDVIILNVDNYKWIVIIKADVQVIRNCVQDNYFDQFFNV